MTRVLLTCPPMILQRRMFDEKFAELGWRVEVPEFEQTLAEEELMAILPDYDAWIIGDDPATRRVVEAGAAGKLKAAVKWGVGVDNVDFEAFKAAGVPVANTPGMFGSEVADIALGYVIALARRTFEIDRGVRSGEWPKPAGVSLADKVVAVVGFGDIGRSTASRLAACEMRVTVYDPVIDPTDAERAGYEFSCWPDRLEDCDFIVFTCALTNANRHMLNASVLGRCKRGVHVVNVARGPLIDQAALVEAQRNGIVRSCALDVFEQEPLPSDSPLREFNANVFGSHNASNTVDAVRRTSFRAIELLHQFL